MSGNMAGVPDGSVESGVREALRTLGVAKTLAEIERYTGKRESESQLRKYGDPGEPKHEISLRAATAIDAALVSEGLPPLFQPVCSQLLELWSNGNAASASRLSIAHMTLAIDAVAGLVTESVLVAETLRDIDGDINGRNSRPEDLAEILKHLQQLDEASRVLRNAVTNAARARGEELGES